jgi:hypothetical protein
MYVLYTGAYIALWPYTIYIGDISACGIIIKEPKVLIGGRMLHLR